MRGEKKERQALIITKDGDVTNRFERARRDKKTRKPGEEKKEEVEDEEGVWARQKICNFS